MPFGLFGFPLFMVTKGVYLMTFFPQSPAAVSQFPAEMLPLQGSNINWFLNFFEGFLKQIIKSMLYYHELLEASFYDLCELILSTRS